MAPPIVRRVQNRLPVVSQNSPTHQGDNTQARPSDPPTTVEWQTLGNSRVVQILPPLFAGSCRIENYLEDFQLLLRNMSGARRQLIWSQMVEELEATGYEGLRSAYPRFEDFMMELRSLGQQLPNRIRLVHVALSLIENMTQLATQSPDRPLAVVLAPAADFNGAFSVPSGYPLLDQLYKSEFFHVLYFEVGGESEARRVLESVHRLTGQRIHTLVITGHGTATALSLGGEDPAQIEHPEGDEAYLTTQDIRLGELDYLDEIVDPQGQVLLWSCSNGFRRDGFLNMANSLALTLRGRTILSAQQVTNIQSLSIDPEDGRLDLCWWDGEVYRAYVDPARPETPYFDGPDQCH